MIAGNNFNDGSGFVPSGLDPPSNSSNSTAAADQTIRNLLVQQYPFENGSPAIDEVLAQYPLSAFPDNQARGAQIFQDVVFAW